MIVSCQVMDPRTQFCWGGLLERFAGAVCWSGRLGRLAGAVGWGGLLEGNKRTMNEHLQSIKPICYR